MMRHSLRHRCTAAVHDRGACHGGRHLRRMIRRPGHSGRDRHAAAGKRRPRLEPRHRLGRSTAIAARTERGGARGTPAALAHRRGARLAPTPGAVRRLADATDGRVASARHPAAPTGPARGSRGARGLRGTPTDTVVRFDAIKHLGVVGRIGTERDALVYLGGGRFASWREPARRSPRFSTATCSVATYIQRAKIRNGTTRWPGRPPTSTFPAACFDRRSTG